MKRQYSIGEIARLFGLSPQTLRKYEQLGIIKLKRQENNYRQFTLPNIEYLMLVRIYRNMGFSLHEIQFLLSRDQRKDNVTMIQQHIADMEAEISRLQRMVNFSKQYLRECHLQAEAFGQIQREQTSGYLVLPLENQDGVLPEALQHNVMKTLFANAPPFRHIIIVPQGQEAAQARSYIIGLAVSNDNETLVPKFTNLSVLPAAQCVSVRLQHCLSKKIEDLSRAMLEADFKSSGVYDFLARENLSICGDIFGLPYYIEQDEEHYYIFAKYFFPIEQNPE